MINITFASISIFLLSLFSGSFTLDNNKQRNNGLTDKQNSKTVVGNKKNVMYLSSYNLDLDSVPEQINGLQKALPSNYYVDYYFMDTKNITYNEEYKEQYFSDLHTRVKSSNKTYDGIIVADDNALDFIITYHDTLFPSVPVVFQGINNKDNAYAARKKDCYTGYVEDINYDKTLEAAFNLIPNAKRINYIVDSSITGEGEKQSFNYCFNEFITNNPQYKEIPVNKIDGGELDEKGYADALKKLGKDEVNIYILYSQDKYGNAYSTVNSNLIIKQNCTAPLFCINEYATIGTYFVGGYIYSHQKASYASMNTLVSRIEKGYFEESVNDLKKTEESLSYYKFDCELLLRFGLNISFLPSSSVLLNYNPSFFEKYYSILIPSLISIILSFSFIVVLSLNYLKLRNKNKQIKEAEEKMKYIASHDYLTGLSSRSIFSKDVTNMIKDQARFSIMILDIDRFKIINDTYGHSVGDATLRKVADFFQEICKGTDNKVYRYAGDEFVFTLKTSNKKEIVLFISKLLDNQKTQFSFGNINISITFSIGVSCYPLNGQDESSLISAADSALYATKNKTKNGFSFYEETEHSRIKEVVDIERELVNSISNDGFIVLYQPIINVKTRQIKSYEAFLRLKSNLYLPSEFIPIAINSGHIIEIEKIVVSKVIKDLVYVRSKGMRIRHVSISLTLAQIYNSEFFVDVDKQLAENDISKEYIEYQIYEANSLINNKNFNEFVAFIKKSDIRLSLSNFDNGKSTINTLMSAPFHYVKLGKKIVDMLATEEKYDSLVALINFIHSLKMKVVAEGVELPNQVKLLTKAECDYFQGYYFEKPFNCDTAIEKKDYVYND